MKTYVYVDGFNLYHGAVEGTPHRWLDLRALAQKMLPRDDIACVKYFTSKVSSRKKGDGGPERQEAYLRALRSIEELEVYFGTFKRRRVKRRLVKTGTSVWVWRTEEKGSDVNLATHLVADGFRGDFEAAVVVSNDSDLKEPIRIVREELGLTVGVLAPAAVPGREPNYDLTKRATFWKPIRKGVVGASQLPDDVVVDGQTVSRPDRWQ
jgi:NYN domain